MFEKEEQPSEDYQKAFEEAVAKFLAQDRLKDAEKASPESPVRFPFVVMKEFAQTMRTIDSMTSENGYSIYTITFDAICTTNDVPEDLFAVNMHCQIKRFEEFVNRYGATITRISECIDSLHIKAVVKNDTLGWFEITAIYPREDLQLAIDGTFEKIDSLADMFMIYAALNDWKVVEHALV